MTRTNGSPPPHSSRCGACGVIGVPAEMTATPDGVCKDIDACLTRMTRHPGNAPDLYASLSLRLGTLRGHLASYATTSFLGKLADRLALAQDVVGHLRVSALQVPPYTEAEVRLVAAALAPEYPGAADDFNYRDDAKRVLEVIHGRAAAVDQAAHEARRMYGKVAAGEVMDRAQAAPCCALFTRQYGCKSHGRQAPTRSEHAERRQCIETRYDYRGDCDGGLGEGITARVAWEGVKVNEPVVICKSHWQQAYRAGEVLQDWQAYPEDTEPEEVLLREGVVVRSGDTLVVTYPVGTGTQKILSDVAALRGAMPDGARVTIVTGTQVAVIRHPEDDL